MIVITEWDGEIAKAELFNWATCPKDGKTLLRKKIKPYFGKIDNDGRNKTDYKFPLGRVVDGKAEYDRDALTVCKNVNDQTVASKAKRIFNRVFGDDKLMEEVENNACPLEKQNATMMPDGSVVDDDKVPRIPLEVSWDDAKAKAALLKWATNDEGKIQKKLLMRWFLDIDGGEGQNPLNYRYPVGNISYESVGGTPAYDPIGINHSWSLASGHKTGVANRMVQRKIIFLKQREKIPLTGDQLEFIERHMTSGDFGKQNSAMLKTYKNELRNASVFVTNNDEFYVVTNTDKLKLNATNEQAAFNLAYEFAKSGNIMDEGIKLDSSVVEDVESPGELKVIEIPKNEVHYNSVAHYGKVLIETPDYIDIPVIPMREGVFIGTDGLPTLKLFDEFSKDAHWLEGQPILEKHTRPDEIVTYKHNRIGKLHSIQVRADSRDVSAIARYYKNKIAPEKLDNIRSGNPYDGSIAYTCETVMQNGEYDGQHYDAVEKTGYHFYHFAEVPEGACSVSRGCGFNLNEAGTDKNDEFYVNKYADGNIMKQNCDGKKKNEKAEMVAEEPVEEVLVVDDDGNECTEAELVDGKCPAAVEDEVPVEEEVKENSKPIEDKTVTVDVRIPEEFTVKMNAIFDENQALKEAVADLTSRLDGMTAKLNEAHETEVKTKEQKDFDAFSARLNQAAQVKANEHYEAFKTEGWAYLDAHADILKSEPVATKLMGVPAASGSTDLMEEKRKLRETLRRKNIA